MSQSVSRMELIGAEPGDKGITVPVRNPPSRLGLLSWSPQLKRNEKELKKVQGRTKLFNCWIAESQWGNTGCTVAF